MKYKNEYHSIMLSRNNDIDLITVLKYKMPVFMNKLSNNNNNMDMIYNFVQINRMALKTLLHYTTLYQGTRVKKKIQH